MEVVHCECLCWHNPQKHFFMRLHLITASGLPKLNHAALVICTTWRLIPINVGSPHKSKGLRTHQGQQELRVYFSGRGGRTPGGQREATAVAPSITYEWRLKSNDESGWDGFERKKKPRQDPPAVLATWTETVQLQMKSAHHTCQTQSRSTHPGNPSS